MLVLIGEAGAVIADSGSGILPAADLRNFAGVIFYDRNGVGDYKS
jgi:hypothetical protein